MAKKRRYKKRKTASKVDVAVIALIVISVLFAVLIYTKSGIIGTKLNEICGGMFAIAIKMACDGKDELKSKIIQYLILIVSLSVLFSLFQIAGGELQTNKELSEVVQDAYSIGTQSRGGGAIGAVAAVPLTNLLRRSRSNYSMYWCCKEKWKN